jgi:O-antigen biosynthesis protein
MAVSQVPGVPVRFEPAEVLEADITLPLPDLSSRGSHDHVLLVVQMCGEAIGMMLRSRPEIETPELLAEAINADLGSRLDAACAGHGLTQRPALTAAGVAHDGCRFREARAAAVNGSGISVIVCTRDRADSLRRCLQSVLRSHHGSCELVVVDNAPATDATRRICNELADDARVPPRDVRYVLEPDPGLSRARNAGIAHARHELIAFVDDDERVDPWWLTELVREFDADPGVGCVSGIVLPAELENEAQAQFEQFGGHSKGRGFRRVVFDQNYLRTVQPAMYPLPAFGVGANMAFRKSTLNDIGQFDVALGAGMPTHGSEDTYAFSEVLLAGWRMVYTPNAITWHYHRRDAGALSQQLFGYGVGLGAYYTALLRRNPRRLLPLIRLLPHALSDLRDPNSPRNASSASAPDAPSGVSVRGIVVGPAKYASARRRARRISRASGRR